MSLAVSELSAYSHGVSTTAEGRTLWRVWAPGKKVSLVTWPGGARREETMRPLKFGYFELETEAAPEGLRYAFRVAGCDLDLPDPATRWQPDGVHKPSAVLKPEGFVWHDADWKGLPQSALAIYELHVGTFTPEGTFDAIIPRLRELAELGVTALEIMPVSQFPGARNWGYDGVHPFAVQNTYGGPHGLARLVDAAHQQGLAVLLDAVYNHFGPEGNYVGQFGPYFTDRYHTPWGKALNFDGYDSDPLRKFVIDNACQWIRDFHLDGLRLDAVQTIFDESGCHILAEIEAAVEEVSAQTGRTAVIIAETDQNDRRLIDAREQGGYGVAGVWADDLHHSIHSLVTGQTDGYYLDFGQPEHLVKSLNEGFCYDGCWSEFRRRRHGNRAADLPRERFVTCIQNHDQVGNRPLGDRLGTLATPAGQRLAAAVHLLSPYTPLLFMGEEYGETRPFPFFCSFLDKGLIEAVRRGRKAEFSSLSFNWKGEIPDPQGEQTFASAVLSWDWAGDKQRQGLRRLYQILLSARKVCPALVDRSHTRARAVGNLLILERGDRSRSCLTVWANLSSAPLAVSETFPTGSRWILSTAEERFGGSGRIGGSVTELAAHEVLVWGEGDWFKESE